jgi:hypothetical protein
MVPLSEVCVQPKTRTAQVGCTLRSLTHHLALLPPIGEVETSWLIGIDAEEHEAADDRPLNLLLVPFPYAVDDDSLVAGPRCFPPELAAPPGEVENRASYFDVRQTWLRHDGADVTAEQITDFLRKLLGEARAKGKPANGLILPELSLDKARAVSVAKLLAGEPGLELFMAGIATPGENGLPGKNQVYNCLFSGGRVYTEWCQSKHHRWRLDRGQISGYKYDSVLSPDDLWWEHIDIQQRHCAFYVFRQGASLASLVCEDLARIDPVQPVLRCVGPNLVVALLMDNPQLEWRWPGRYATVLADDPGSAVLTFTSLGLMKRSGPRKIRSQPVQFFRRVAENLGYPVPVEEEVPRRVALWKDPNRRAESIRLDEGCHAVLLEVGTADETNFTLDSRGDANCTVGLTLKSVTQIPHRPPVPAWID